MKHFIGVDIGGTSTTIGLVTEEGEILDRSTIQIADFSSYAIDIFLEEIASHIQELADQHTKVIEAVGIGAPNGNFFKGTMEYAPNMPWKEVHPIASVLAQALNCKVLLTNDANAAAMGEKQFGSAKDFNDFIEITLGTGLGSGIMAGGGIIYGHDGFAGELGHSILIPDGRPCSCGRKGCLEAYVSIRGILQTYQEQGGDEKRTPKEIAEKAREGDALGQMVYRKTGQWLGLKLADAATYTSPEAIILFGGIAASSDLFLPHLKSTMEANIHNLYRNKIQVLTSGLPLNDAAIMGAVALVM